VDGILLSGIGAVPFPLSTLLPLTSLVFPKTSVTTPYLIAVTQQKEENETQKDDPFPGARVTLQGTSLS
jgi:hypothetical protein